MVRLKDGCNKAYNDLLSYFNSTMVRLKEKCGYSDNEIHVNFNSTMVRLKGGECYPSMTFLTISIPLWFG